MFRISCRVHRGQAPMLQYTGVAGLECVDCAFEGFGGCYRYQALYL